MKRRRLSMFLLLCMIIGLTPATALADWCPMDMPDGTVEVWGTISYTYTVGEAFRSEEVGLNHYENKRRRWYGDHLEFWANGEPISDGYQFQTVGNKVITVKRYDKQAQYTLQVVPKLNGRLETCSIAVSPRTDYLQGVDGFDPKNVVVTCQFKDGSFQNLTYKELEFYVGARGMRDHKGGTAIQVGDCFPEVGDQDLIIRVVNQEMRVPLTVQPGLSRVSPRALPDLKAAKNAGFLTASQLIDPQGQITRPELDTLSAKLQEELGGAAGGIQNVTEPMSREQAYVTAWQTLSSSPQWMEASTGDFPRGTYYLTYWGNENKVADIASASHSVGAWCIMWDKSGGQPEHQKFVLKRRGDYYKLLACHTGMALEASDTEKGAVLVQKEESGAPNQLFKINKNADGSISLINPDSGLFVGVSANQLQGGPLILWPAAADGSQNFKLVSVQ